MVVGAEPCSIPTILGGGREALLLGANSFLLCLPDPRRGVCRLESLAPGLLGPSGRSLRWGNARWSRGGGRPGCLRPGSETASRSCRGRSSGVPRGQSLEQGIGLGQLALALDVNPELTKAIVVGLTDLEVSGAVVSASRTNQGQIDSDPRWQQARAILEGAGMAPPSIRELGLDGELLRVLVRSGRLVRVDRAHRAPAAPSARNLSRAGRPHRTRP